ncbi:MAG: drug/metabolite transporter (DMT)-like permease [Parvicella sp.]|jgi:drug/metabolite transporter (DMT)-like permease
MLDLLLTIALFNVLLICFKLFPKYRVDNLQALTVNYLTAGICGLIMYEGTITISGVLSANWLYHAIIIGILFIVVFNFFAQATQQVGLTVATIANKMSLLFPFIFSLIIYPSDVLTGYKVIGLILAIIGIVLTSINGGKLNFNKKYIGLVLIVFIGQGIADIVFTDCSRLPGAKEQTELIFVVLFFIAAIVGVLMIAIRSTNQKVQFSLKNIFWGIALGIPNYGTLYFMFRALNSSGLSATEVYPVISMGAVLSSAILGLFIFKEKLTKTNWIGILSALLGILTLTFGKQLW